MSDRVRGGAVLTNVSRLSRNCFRRRLGKLCQNYDEQEAELPKFRIPVLDELKQGTCCSVLIVIPENAAACMDRRSARWCEKDPNLKKQRVGRSLAFARSCGRTTGCSGHSPNE